MLEWLRKNEYIWKKGHRLCRDRKKKQAAWKDKAESLGKLNLKKFGQANSRTGRGTSWPSAVSWRVRSTIGSSPTETVFLTKTTDSQVSLNQEPPPVFSEGPTAETLSIAPPLMKTDSKDTVEDSSLLSQMEEQTVVISGQPISTSTTSSRGRKQKGRLKKRTTVCC